MIRYRPSHAAVALTVATALMSGCRTPDPRARGEELLKAVSATLASAQTLSVAADETTERVARDGTARREHLVRQVTLRRPDRLWFKTTGDRDVEGFYDGTRLTLVFHTDKVFGVLPTPPTLDDTVHTLSERYDISLPIGDLLTSDPHRALVSSQTTGGWSGDEDVGGVRCARLDWQHPNVDWSIWIPASGQPLPTKLQVNYKNRQRTTTVLFTNWNLAPNVSDETFTSRVPDDYEGVAVIQRASAVLPPDAKPDSTTPQE